MPSATFHAVLESWKAFWKNTGDVAVWEMGSAKVTSSAGGGGGSKAFCGQREPLQPQKVVWIQTTVANYLNLAVHLTICHLRIHF